MFPLIKYLSVLLNTLHRIGKTMPRLSMWKPNKTNDYYFLDNNIREQFHVGGTGANIHKYVGPQDQPDSGDVSIPNYADADETTIQDLLFLENRDRKYDQDVYEMRGVYNISDSDFDLSQFGLFLSNDMLFMSFHMNEMVEILGRRLMAGDVIELPHLLDDLGLDAGKAPIPKFYVVQDASRGSEGYSVTWRAHIWRVKLSPITDSQEYSDVLGNRDDEDSLVNLMSTYNTEMDISNAVVASAENVDPTGTPLLDHLYGVDATSPSWEYGETLASGSSFPVSSKEGDYFVRTDFEPNRLFVRRGTKWHRLYDNIGGQTWSEKTFNAVEFINNIDTTITADGNESDQRQALSKTILPKSDV
jgi:hypothetical protein